MTISLTRVKDIGPVAAATLAKHGIDSVERLASLSPAQLGEVPGFGLRRSARVIAAAKSLLATAESAGMDLSGKAGPLKSRSGVVVAEKAGKEGRDKKNRKKGKGKSRPKAGQADKQSKKGKGGKSKDKGDKKRSGRKKGEKKRDKKKGRKKK